MNTINFDLPKIQYHIAVAVLVIGMVFGIIAKFLF